MLKTPLPASASGFFLAQTKTPGTRLRLANANHQHPRRLPARSVHDYRLLRGLRAFTRHRHGQATPRPTDARFAGQGALYGVRGKGCEFADCLLGSDGYQQHDWADIKTPRMGEALRPDFHQSEASVHRPCGYGATRRGRKSARVGVGEFANQTLRGCCGGSAVEPEQTSKCLSDVLFVRQVIVG